MDVTGDVRALTTVTQEKKLSHCQPFPNTLASGDPLIKKDVRDKGKVILIFQTFQQKQSRRERVHTESNHGSEGGGGRQVPSEGRRCPRTPLEEPEVMQWLR